MKWLREKLDLNTVHFYDMQEYAIYQNDKSIKWGRISVELAHELQTYGGHTFHEIFHDLKDKNLLSDRELLLILKNLVAHNRSENTFHYKDKMAFFLVTKRCNLYCKTCYMNANNHDLGYEMTIQEIEASFQKLQKEGFGNITISGGEPFIRKDIKEILYIAKRYFNRVSVNTNGTLLTRDMVVYLKENDIAIMLSLEGATGVINNEIRGRGTYEKIVEAIHYFVDEEYYNLTISITITKINKSELTSIYNLCHQYGIKMTMGVFLETGRGLCNSESLKISPKEQLDCYLDLLEKMCEEHKEDQEVPAFLRKCCTYCGAVYSILNIMPDGAVFPCPNLIEPQWKLGNILEDTYEEIIERAVKQNEVVSRYVNKVSSCKDCALKYLCGGGCMANAYFEEGSLYAKDPLCEFYKIIYRAYLANWDFEKSDVKNVRGVIAWCRERYN